MELNDQKKNPEGQPEIQNEELRNPAYPAGHPMNAKFDHLESSGETKV